MCAAARLAHLVALILIVGPTFAACRNGQSGAGAGGAVGAGAVIAPVVILHSGGRAIPIRVEVARTDAQRERGLMYRNHMDTDAGMLFIFDHDGPLTFWMKNTLIPLDMIFINVDRRIVGIVEDALPETETARRVAGDSRYVLEIGGGLSRRLGVSAGTMVDFQGLAGEVNAPPN